MGTPSRWTALLVSVLTALLFACQGSNQPAPESETATTDTGKGATKKEAAKAAPREERITVPAGTTLDVRLVDGLDSGKAAEGASFQGTLASALVVRGVEVAAVGSDVTGKVTSVVSSGRLSKPAELSLVLTSLTPKGGREVPISTETWGMQGQSHKKRDIEMIGGGAAAGALIGALTGGKKGAAIGAGVGAGGGTGVAAATGKKEIVLPPEANLSFKLSQPVTLARR